MTKRLRGGPVMVQSKRTCLTLKPVATTLKRKRDDVDEFVRQFKPRMAEPERRGVKRSAECFDQELHRLEKRMRATVPTAEEAIAFLLPHITQMRQMYNAERARAATLESNNIVIRRSCLHLLREKKRLESELEMTNYRLSLSGPKPYDAWPTI